MALLWYWTFQYRPSRKNGIFHGPRSRNAHGPKSSHRLLSPTTFGSPTIFVVISTADVKIIDHCESLRLLSRIGISSLTIPHRFPQFWNSTDYRYSLRRRFLSSVYVPLRFYGDGGIWFYDNFHGLTAFYSTRFYYLLSLACRYGSTVIWQSTRCLWLLWFYGDSHLLSLHGSLIMVLWPGSGGCALKFSISHPPFDPSDLTSHLGSAVTTGFK